MRFLLPAIVVCAAIAGSLAYWQSHSEQEATIRYSGSWSALHAQPNQAGIRKAAAHYLQLVDISNRRAASRSAAQKYLRTLGDSGSAQGRLGEWAAQLPTSRLRTHIDTLHLPRRRVATVAGTLQLLTPRTDTRAKPLELHFELVVQQTKRTWSVVDSRLESEGLGHIEHPLLQVHGNIGVLSDRRVASLATRVLERADLQFPKLVAKYRSVGGSKQVLILVIDRVDLAANVLGAATEKSDSIIAHASGLTYENGDVAMFWPAMLREAQVTRYTTVTHELTHVATLPLFAKAPTMILEGLATYEETVDLRAKYGNASVNLALLDRAFQSKSVGYLQLLRTTEAEFGRHSETAVAVGYLAGYATIAEILRKEGEAKLIAFLVSLKQGTPVDAALKSVLNTDAVRLQQRVRAFAHDPPAVEPVP
jgi:hypothetical protein